MFGRHKATAKIPFVPQVEGIWYLPVNGLGTACLVNVVWIFFAMPSQPNACSFEAGSDPRGHLWVTWGVNLGAGKPPLADIILSHPPDLTRCDSVIGLAIRAMSGHIQYRGAAS